MGTNWGEMVATELILDNLNGVDCWVEDKTVDTHRRPSTISNSQRGILTHCHMHSIVRINRVLHLGLGHFGDSSKDRLRLQSRLLDRAIAELAKAGASDHGFLRRGVFNTVVGRVDQRGLR